MTYTTNKIQQFVHSWDFVNPRWENLPSDFPNCDTSFLTNKQDKHLFGAIKTAWIIDGGGRKAFYKALAKQALLGLGIVALAVLIGKNLITLSEKGIARSVSAKTFGQTIGEIIESTRSAILKIKYD